MKLITKLVRNFSKEARKKRAALFRNSFQLDENTKILDLGSETGSAINLILQDTPIKPENVYIADINSDVLEKGKEQYGFVPVLIDESGRLPFDDQFFDIVYCSSVIEHVTVPKKEVWSFYSGEKFKQQALKHQKEFAREIQRLGKQYFVQTPYRYFPVESHSWLPFIGWLPRRLVIPILKFTNLFWLKKTYPDWYLLKKNEMSMLFEDRTIIDEKSFGLTKSIMAIKSEKESTS